MGGGGTSSTYLGALPLRAVAVEAVDGEPLLPELVSEAVAADFLGGEDDCFFVL